MFNHVRHLGIHIVSTVHHALCPPQVATMWDFIIFINEIIVIIITHMCVRVSVTLSFSVFLCCLSASISCSAYPYHKAIDSFY